MFKFTFCTKCQSRSLPTEAQNVQKYLSKINKKYKILMWSYRAGSF